MEDVAAGTTTFSFATVEAFLAAGAAERTAAVAEAVFLFGGISPLELGNKKQQHQRSLK